MNDGLVAFVLLAAIFVWQQVSSRDSVQESLHSLGQWTGVVQWYSILFFALGALILWTLLDIYSYDCQKLQFLDSSFAGNITGLSEAEQDDLTIEPKLKGLSLLTPMLGFIAALQVAEHVGSMVYWEIDRARQRRDALPWKMGYEMTMVLLVIAMPIVFIAMALRAQVRAWAVMTGSAYEYSKDPNKSWPLIEKAEMATYATDLDLAVAFQYATVCSFGVLCMHYMQNAPDEYRFALRWAGLQGVYLYVIMGVVQSLGSLAVTVMPLLSGDDASSTERLLQKAVAVMGPIVFVAMALCIYNMLIIASMSDVQQRLGWAGCKFHATRALILIGQLQLPALLLFAKGGFIYECLQEGSAKIYAPKLSALVVGWDMSAYRAKLLHAALLNVWCFAVVIFNRQAWPPSVDFATGVSGTGKIRAAAARQPSGGDHFPEHDAPLGGGLQDPLLSEGP